MTEQEVNQIQEIAFTACKIIQEKGKNKISSSDRKKNKNIKIGLSLFRKAEEAKIINSKDDKSTTLKEINKLKIININDKKFLENFSEFLSGNSIEIFSDTKLPNITNNKYIFLFTQNEFWIKYIIYISIKYKKDLSIFNFIIFIELFYTWNNNSLDDDFNQEIIKAITSIFDNETINKFLSSNKINSLNDLFERYKSIHINNNYKEIKINTNNNECQCPICTNNGFVNKIIDYNKKHNIISYSKDNNISFIKKISENRELNKYYDVDVFDYLNRIEKRKTDKENNSRNSSNKKKSNIKNSNKKRNKSISNNSNNKKGRNDKIQEIYELLNIDVDMKKYDQSDDENDKESSTVDYSKKNKNKKKKKKYYT